MASNGSSTGMMLNENFAPGTGSASLAPARMVNLGSTSFALSHLRPDSFVTTTYMLNDRDANNILPMQNSIGYQGGLNDQLNAFTMDDIIFNMCNDVRTCLILSPHNASSFYFCLLYGDLTLYVDFSGFGYLIF